MALHQNIIDQKIIKTQFYNKVVCLAEKRMKPPLDQWIEAVKDKLMDEKADQFYFSRKMQFVSRLAFDSFVLHCMKRRQKNL